MEKDKSKFGQKEGDSNYENPYNAETIVVPGHAITADMKESKWDFILNHQQTVFACTSKQQKLLIVENYQCQGLIVVVTGDSINNSPAIKKVNIGIAMGIMRSDMSKNAAT